MRRRSGRFWQRRRRRAASWIGVDWNEHASPACRCHRAGRRQAASAKYAALSSQGGGVQIAAIADIAEEAAREQAQVYQAKAYSDPLAMLQNERLDAVSLCTPPKSHRELTEAAAAVGTHVLCEKPMAPTLA